MPRLRRNRRTEGELDDEAAFPEHAPERFEKCRLVNIDRRVIAAAVESDIANRDRLHVAVSVDDRLHKRALEREHAPAIGRRAFGKDRDCIACSEHVARLLVDSMRIPAAAAIEKQRPTTRNQAAEHRPAFHLGLGDEPRRPHGMDDEDVEP